jgi:integrase
VAVLGLEEEEVKSTSEYRNQRKLPVEDANSLLRSRYLAYAETTWSRHAAAIRSLNYFCKSRLCTVFTCTDTLFNLFLLDELKKGTTVSVIKSTVDAYSFVVKFFGELNVSESRAVHDILKFIEKVGKRNSNKKCAFGEAELLTTYRYYVKKFGPFENWPLLESRTFMLALVQTVTFCRYSEIQNVEVNDIQFDTDYFKILIKKSKTDQQSRGEYVYIPKMLGTPIDGHMMFCLYLKRLDCGKKSGNVKLFSSLKWNARKKIYEMDPQKCLSYNVALKNFKNMLNSAGFIGSNFGLHSPRIGATTDAFFNKVPEHVIDQRGRWKSKNSKYNYLRLNEKHLIASLQNS